MSENDHEVPQPGLETASPIAEPGIPLPPAATPAHVAHIITRRAVIGWVLFDLANTIFSMGVLSLAFPLWVRETVGASRADAVYGTITAISMGIIFLISPLIGAMSDRRPRRMPFLVTSTLICVFFTCLLGRFGFLPSLIFFIIANAAYQASTQFDDSLLPEVSTEANRGKIGGIAVGIGYFGSYIAVTLGVVFADQPKSVLFTVIGLTFLLFALPCFIFVKERGNPNPRPIEWDMLRNYAAQTIATLRSGREYPGLLRFLLGRVFYTDAINTVISIMALYTVNVAVSSGLNEEHGEKQANMILMSAITFAVAGGFFWGWLTDRLGPKSALNYVLRCWMGIFIGAALVGVLGLPLWCLYVVAASAGFCLGGVWAADRPFMLRLTPPWRIGEFYGLYGMVGRFSAITGPVIWAMITHLMNRALGSGNVTDIQRKAEIARTAQGVSVLVLLLMVIASYLILRRVSDEPRQWPQPSPVLE